MEFGEKLCELRKNKGLTQEELAEALFVSRTAVSKWESGRGYPSIDSLKEISRFFSVSIDVLLSGEKIISIAEKENKDNMKSLCDLLLGASDVLWLALAALPLYPKTADCGVFAVNLFEFSETSPFNLMTCRILFAVLAALGAAKLLLSFRNTAKGQKVLTHASVLIGIFAALFLAMARYAYAASAAFVLMIIKGMLILKYVKSDSK